jgi:hypothetical protein
MIDLIRQEIQKTLSRLTFFAIGEIVKIDFSNYQAQAKILTSGMKTNWLRIGTDYSGDSFGEVKSLNIGDEVLIVFPDGNPGAQGIIIRRLFGKDAPPALGEDEIHILHKSGTDFLTKKDGEVTQTSVKKHNINGNPTVNLNGESYSAVLYEELKSNLESFMDWTKNHLHVGNLGAPTPLNPSDITTLEQIKSQIPKFQSQKVKLGG